MKRLDRALRCRRLCRVRGRSAVCRPRPAAAEPCGAGLPPTRTLTAVPGIKVGHHTLTERPTGCTVVLVEAGATAGVDVRGARAGARATPIC